MRLIKVRLGRVTYRKLQDLKSWLGLPKDDAAAVEELIKKVWLRHAYLIDQAPK